MAKPLSEKGRVIRAAIQASPELGNSELAEQLSKAAQRKQDGLHITAHDVAGQRKALQKAGNQSASPEERDAGKSTAPSHQANGEPPASAAEPGLTANDLRELIALVRKAGGTNQLVEVLEVLSGVSK